MLEVVVVAPRVLALEVQAVLEAVEQELQVELLMELLEFPTQAVVVVVVLSQITRRLEQAAQASSS